MVDEKDRFGDKLRALEKAREDQWAAQNDKVLLEKLRAEKAALSQAAEQVAATAKELAAVGHALCPRCAQPLAQKKHGRHQVMACPAGHGAWFDTEEMEHLR